MANTSPDPIAPDPIAQRVLDACLAGQPWQPEDVDSLVDTDSDALLSVVAEGLSDRFDPRLTEAYVDIFSHAIARLDDRFTADELRARYRHVRRPWPYRPATPTRTDRILEMEAKALRRLRTQGAAYHVPGIVPHPDTDDAPGPAQILLLSRVTLGADIVVTGMVAQALRARFPQSQLTLAGSPKSAELLGLPCAPIAYPRSGGLRSRLRVLDDLALEQSYSLVVDPDSRLTQLGLYPVVSQDRYCFFDSREVSGPGSLADHTRDWCAQVFDVDIPRPTLTPPEPPFQVARPAVTVSFGVGGNESKRIGGDFEHRLLRELSATAATVIVDKGAGKEEAERAEAAAAGLPNIRFWDGSFAAFAALIANSDLYVGYDSAGQHAAAALDVPLISIFAGAVNDTFFERWKPEGRVLRIDGGSEESVFLRVRSALARVTALRLS